MQTSDILQCVNTSEGQQRQFGLAEVNLRKLPVKQFLSFFFFFFYMFWLTGNGAEWM